ncbi:hypothetical protein DF182_21095 [Chitinophaga flava]|uniref:Uncharacterized protein n=1 Tax=Chitinophaga flava TaxID=2259036 RepID=A0A365XRR5_9BACT|nr:hypothetical protein DF182_21095 [Chitinophaga flava]
MYVESGIIPESLEVHVYGAAKFSDAGACAGILFSGYTITKNCYLPGSRRGAVITGSRKTNKVQTQQIW